MWNYIMQNNAKCNILWADYDQLIYGNRAVWDTENRLILAKGKEEPVRDGLAVWGQGS